MSSDERALSLTPLGAFAPAGRDEQWTARNIKRLPEMSADLREKLASYLSACPVFLAWMQHTRDEIGDRFGVDGGSAIASDGTYYWRVDALAYIKEYGAPVPAEALRHFEERRWQPPNIDRPTYLRIYHALDELLGGGEVVS